MISNNDQKIFQRCTTMTKKSFQRLATTPKNLSMMSKNDQKIFSKITDNESNDVLKNCQKKGIVNVTINKKKKNVIINLKAINKSQESF